VPKAIALADPTFAAIAAAATIQVTASVIVTAVLTPLLTSFVYKRVQRQHALGVQAAPPILPTAVAPSSHAD
jgi:2-keto-3-deoxygluconate permease